MQLAWTDRGTCSSGPTLRCNLYSAPLEGTKGLHGAVRRSARGGAVRK